jgi:hypothetical protein
MTKHDLDKFHGITVAQLLPDGNLSFGQVKNSLSGTSLSGNWIFSQDDSDAVSSVCRSHIVVSTEATLRQIEKVSSQSIFHGDFAALVASIQTEENKLRSDWEKHLLDNPKKAKTLVEPNWANWKNELNIEDPVASLIKSGRSAHPDSTPDDMKSLIALARMVRHVIEIWRDVEDGRFSRKFLSISKEDPRLWPSSWTISKRGSK